MPLLEKIRIMRLKYGNLSEAELARRMGISPQNLHNKMKRDNFTEKDLAAIAAAFGCELDIRFIDKSTGEIVGDNEIQSPCCSRTTRTDWLQQRFEKGE